MSEPLSRDALDDALHNSANAKGINPTSERIHDLVLTALHYLDRVTELERLREAAEYVRDASLITADDAMLTDALEKLDALLSAGVEQP